MTLRLTVAAVAALGAAGLSVSACATSPQFPIDADDGAREPMQVARRPEGPGMAPIPNPGEGGSTYRQPGRVSSSELAPISGAATAPARRESSPVPATSGSADRPATYRVRAGDTLFSIGRQFQVSPQALADANGMTFQSILRNGQTLRIPGGREEAPTRMARAEPERPRPDRTEPLSEANPRIPRGDPQRPARSEIRPSPSNPAPPGVTPPPPPASARASTPVPNPGEGPPRARPNPNRPNLAREQAPPPSSVAPIVPSTPAPSSTDVAALGRGLFRWPTEGSVTGRFGPSSGGQRNDGIDISGTLGAPVTAAAAGEVAYSGNSIPGFGNLVLIRHPGGWVTAYGHLQSSSVRMRQTVTQGMPIGAVGQTGNVTAPTLHFEVRYAPSARDRARPIDPLTVLPDR